MIDDPIQSNLIESINQSMRESVKYPKVDGSDGGVESKSIADVSCSF